VSKKDSNLLDLPPGHSQADCELLFETSFWEIRLNAIAQYFTIGISKDRRGQDHKHWHSFGFDEIGWGFCYHPPYNTIYCSHDNKQRIPKTQSSYRIACKLQEAGDRIGILFNRSKGLLSFYINGEIVCEHPDRILTYDDNRNSISFFPAIVTPDQHMTFIIPDSTTTRNHI